MADHASCLHASTMPRLTYTTTIICNCLFIVFASTFAKAELESDNPQLLAWPREKYFYHELEGGAVQHCPGYGHQMHGLACAIAEAAYLNRTLLFSDQFCQPNNHQFNGQTLWRPFEDVFNITKLRKHARIELVSDPSKYVKELTPGSSVMYLRDEIMADRLLEFEDMEVLVRMHRYWPEDPTGKWGWREWWNQCFESEELMRRMEGLKGDFGPTDKTHVVAHAVMNKMGGPGGYCALHVRRGDKLQEVEGLDEATQPAAIHESIKDRCTPGRTLYLATNEKDPHFFDDLKQHWTVVTYRDFIDDMKSLDVFRYNETSQQYYVHDNLYLYQAESLIVEAANPWMETFCILYHGHHQACHEDWQANKNACVYRIPGLNGLVG